VTDRPTFYLQLELECSQDGGAEQKQVFENVTVLRSSWRDEGDDDDHHDSMYVVRLEWLKISRAPLYTAALVMFSLRHLLSYVVL